MSNNHPNRNWRARARQAAAAFAEQYADLSQLQPTPAGVQMLLREAYLAGFAAGREDVKPRKPRDA